MILRIYLLFILLAITGDCIAQAGVQDLLTAGPAIAGASQEATILNGPWKFHAGDDPRWADPGFNDADWQTYTIDPGHALLTLPEVLEASPQPGWQAHGHPDYVGYAWYRISVDGASSGSALAILMPQYVDDAYQVYVNGKQIGAFGQFEGHRFVYASRPVIFPIPSGAIPAAGPVSIAIRFLASRFWGLPTIGMKHGGLRGVPLLGPAPLLAVCYEAVMGQITSQIWASGTFAFLWGSVGLISLFLFTFTRTRREYLWAGISLTGIAIMSACDLAGRLTRFPIQFMLPCRFVGMWIGLSAGPLFVMYLLDVDKPLWRRLNYVSIAMLTTSIALTLSVYLGLAPPTAAWDKAFTLLSFALGAGAPLVFAIAVDGVRTLGSKAWMPLAPGLFGACGLALELAGPRFTTVSEDLKLLVPAALLVVFLLRAAEQQRENEQYLLDMRQAQEVQQLLLPEHLPQMAGFAIKSVYLPAREVGGDFFQILEGEAKSILIVFGDVAGKGLPAAMLVAMLVGAIRTRIEDTGDPAKILSALNDCLCGKTRGGFATCIAVHISATGAVHLANAGHLAPYMDGSEITLEGALPLGIAAGIDFAATSFLLEPGAQLTFISDGVVEAKNAQRELFGFDRAREISTQPADQIADAAMRFGQEDDITVLTVGRVSTSPHKGAICGGTPTEVSERTTPHTDASRGNPPL